MKNVEFSRGLVVPLMKRNMIDARTFNFRDKLSNVSNKKNVLVLTAVFHSIAMEYLIVYNNGRSKRVGKNEMHIQNLPGPMIMPKIFKCCSSRYIFCCSLRCIFCYSPRCIFWQFQAGGGGGCSRPVTIPSSSAPNNIHMDKRVHGQTEERSARWPGRHFRPGYKRSFGQCLSAATLFSYK